MPLSQAQPRAHAPLDAGEPYSRRSLFRSAEREVMLATWQAGRACAPHDHGTCTGIVIVLAGRFEERIFEAQSQGLECTRTRLLSLGAIAIVSEGLVHSMRALSAGRTLHVYSPGITQMRVFDLARRETLWVGENTGAWIPQNQSEILARATWDDVKP